MGYIRPFGPKPTNAQNTVNIAVTSANASVQLVGTPNQGYQSVRIANFGTSLIFANFSVLAGTASIANDMPILANTAEVFWLPKNIAFVNVISIAASGSTMYATVGEGT